MTHKHSTSDEATDIPTLMSGMVTTVVTRMIEQSDEAGDAGWKIEIIPVGVYEDEMRFAVIAAVIVDGELVYGPLAFPLDWSADLANAMLLAIKHHESNADLHNARSANRLPA